jgi:hypothetical protein
MTQLELSKKTGVCDRTIRDIELGKSVKSGRRKADTLGCLATALELPRDLLLSLDGLDPSPDGNWFGSPPTVASLMEHLGHLQGIAADVTTARAVCARQRAALCGLMCIADVPSMRAYWGRMGERNSDDRGELEEFVGRVLAHVRRLREDLASAIGAPVECIVVATIERLRDEWRRIPYADGIDNAIFAEYVLGLAYFETFVHLAITLDGERIRLDRCRLPAALNASSYSAGLDGAFTWQEDFLARINAAYDDASSEDLWGAFMAAWEKKRALLQRDLRCGGNCRKPPVRISSIGGYRDASAVAPLGWLGR